MEERDILFIMILAVFIANFVAGCIVYVVGMFIVKFNDKHRKSKQTEYIALTYLKGTKNPNEVPIDVEGEAQDNLLSTTVIANKLVSRSGENIHILVFASLFNEASGNIQRILTLLREVSMLNMNIDWVNDATVEVRACDVINILTRNGIRCDNLFDETEVTMDILNKYDVIFHPNAGMKASYETIAKVIKMLSEDSTTITG